MVVVTNISFSFLCDHGAGPRIEVGLTEPSPGSLRLSRIASQLKSKGTFVTFDARVEAAETYEREWVPAMLQEWAEHTTDAAQVEMGHEVLDVGCGTGVVARECLRRVGDAGKVTGLDLSDAMLTVARRIEPQIDWRKGEAGSLPFADESFDRAVSQFALMFFPDRSQAVREIWRVLKGNGRIAVTVAGAISDSPAYEVLAELIRPVDPSYLDQRFSLGDPDEALNIFRSAGVDHATVTTHWLPERFASPSAFVEAEVCTGAELAARFDDESWNAVLEAANRELAPYVNSLGRIEFMSSGHTVTATKEPFVP